MSLALWAVRLRNQRVSTGEEGMVGLDCVVSKDFVASPDGKSFVGKIDVRGEIWNAKSESELKKGQAAVVDSIDGLGLHIKLKGE